MAVESRHTIIFSFRKKIDKSDVSRFTSIISENDPKKLSYPPSPYCLKHPGMDLRKAAQWLDDFVPGLRLRDTIPVPGISGTRLRDTIVSLIVFLSCPLNMSLKDTYRFWNFRNFQGHELCCLPGIVSCPWIVSMDMSLSRHNNGARKFRDKNQGHDSGTWHGRAPDKSMSVTIHRIV